VLYSFNFGPDGHDPYSRLTFDAVGNIYGTTTYGGASGYGTVYELSPNGSGDWTEQVIYSFCSVGAKCSDGATPFLSYVTLDSAGNLYGTTTAGGANGYGVVFELSPAMIGGGWSESVLYSFSGTTDGAYPSNGLIVDANGNFYGTTMQGGSGPCSAGCGTVFELSPSESGWVEQVIYNIENEGYYIFPGHRLVPCGNSGLAMDADGNIFSAVGLVVFELTPNGNGGWNPTVIHVFPSHPSVVFAGTPVLDNSGNIYSTIQHFGRSGNQPAILYKLSKANGEWKIKTLARLWGDGPSSGEALLLDAAGNIYGTTLSGGNGNGSVFELVAPTGKSKKYEYKMLWSFNFDDGSEPGAGLILDKSGNLYGSATQQNGPANGVVYEVTP
jgi:uncharacterized repeat protein (TIGR03803 family)